MKTALENIKSKLKFYELDIDQSKFILDNSSSIEDHTALFEEIDFIKKSILDYRLNYIINEIDFSIIIIK